MKIKKTKFAKLLALASPIAVISIVTPVVLTSCGSSNSTTTPDKPDNGGSGGGNTGGGESGSDQNPNVVTAEWDTSKFQDGITKDNDNNPVITLTDTDFANTGLTKISTLNDIKTSLTPSSGNFSKVNTFVSTKDDVGESVSTQKATLYSLLSPAIKNLDNFNVTVNINPNNVVFDYTNDNVANTINGQFILTPKTQMNNSRSNQTLTFTIQNFNDSYNGSEDGKKIVWDTTKIDAALKNGVATTGNKLPETNSSANGAIVSINLSNDVTLTQVMYDLNNTTLSGCNLSEFIKGGSNSFKVNEASISNWSLSIDHSKMFTRIVVPSNDTNSQEAILYIVYTGYSYKNISGSPIWNRNIPYLNVESTEKDLWDKKYNEPIIDLGNVNGTFGGVALSKDLKARDLMDNAKNLAQYMSQNYLLGYSNFKVDVGDNATTSKIGEFVNGDFVVNGSEIKTKTASNIMNNDNVIQVNVLLKAKDSFTTPSKDENGFDTTSKGFWKAFYIIGYNTDE